MAGVLFRDAVLLLSAMSITYRKRIARAATALAMAVPVAWWLRHTLARSVRVWRPGVGRFVRAGKLSVRVAGSGDRAFLLLHGLVSSGDTFGSDYDRLAEHGRLIVPDLLGFSRSMSDASDGFSLEDHLDSLDQMMSALGADDARFVVVGHSLGALIALHWAARRSRQVNAVVLFGAPLFRDESEARRQLKKMGALESLFAQDSPLAAKSCALMCAHRRLAGFLAVALSPDLPVALSSKAVLHTWPAYRGALGIFFSDWQSALAQLQENCVPVTLAAGGKDRSQVAGLSDQLATRFSSVHSIRVSGASHILPITHGDWCAWAVDQESRGSSDD